MTFNFKFPEFFIEKREHEYVFTRCIGIEANTEISFYETKTDYYVAVILLGFGFEITFKKKEK